MAINTHQPLNHPSLDTISLSSSSTLPPPTDSINSPCIMQKHLLLPPQTDKYNNYQLSYQLDKQHKQQKKPKNFHCGFLPKRRTKMKKSFSINNIKQTSNSVDNHPLNHYHERTDPEKHTFEDYHEDSMELDEYDSDSDDDLSYTSCLSSQSNSNYSVVFEKNSTTTTPSSSSNQIPFSYHSFNNDCFLYTSTRSSSSISIPPMNRSQSISSSSHSPVSSQSLLSMSPPSVFCLPSTTTSCSPITTNSISQSLEMERSLRRSSSSDSLYMLLKNSSSPFSSSSSTSSSPSSLLPLSSPSPSPSTTILSPFSKKQTIKTTTKKSMYSNLSTSLRLFRNKLSSYNKENLLKFMMDSPRLTDEKLPLHKQPCPELIQEQEETTTNTTTTPMQELTTFQHSHNLSSENTTHEFQCIKYKYKTRELRTNSRFLILYAFDMNARSNSMTLPNLPSQDELYRIFKCHPNIKKFHYNHNIHRISNLSREKLWNNVILPPRQDDSPDLFIKGEQYILHNDTNEQPDCHCQYSIVRKLGKYMPWAIKPSIKPAGVLPNSKWVFNGQAPNSGITKTQFTIKGWCNPRWVNHATTN